MSFSEEGDNVRCALRILYRLYLDSAPTDSQPKAQRQPSSFEIIPTEIPERFAPHLLTHSSVLRIPNIRYNCSSSVKLCVWIDNKMQRIWKGCRWLIYRILYCIFMCVDYILRCMEDEDIEIPTPPAPPRVRLPDTCQCGSTILERRPIRRDVNDYTP